VKIGLTIMTMTVIALISYATLAADEAVRPSGAATFNHWCVPCHGPGPGHPGTASLEFKYKGSVPAALQQRTDLDPDFVKFTVRHGPANMTSFRKTEITDAELDALANYLARSPAK
jgi:mono/diheme cytochrome c family protein